MLKKSIKNFKEGQKETIQFYIKRYLSSYYKVDNLFTNDINKIHDKIKEIRNNNKDIKLKIAIGSLQEEDCKRLKRYGGF